MQFLSRPPWLAGQTFAQIFPLSNRRSVVLIFGRLGLILGKSPRVSEDINQQILKELQKSRRSNQAILIIASITVIALLFSRRKPSEPDHSWTAVTTAMRQSDFPRALSMAQANAALHPNDYYGHAYLGSIYLEMDDLTNSEAQYLKAYELFPIEENEKNLAAVRKRLAMEKESKPSK
jgi:tetratricopeptide (TPR) repeat protein